VGQVATSHPDPGHPKAGNGRNLDQTLAALADNGQLEIRNLAERKQGQCTVTAVFQLSLGPEVARRLSAAGDVEITPVQPRIFRTHFSTQRIFRTIDTNFVPGSVAPVAVVMTVRDWNTGMTQDWVVYTVRPGFSRMTVFPYSDAYDIEPEADPSFSPVHDFHRNPLLKGR
jgi:hypothetical protein